MFDIRLIKFYMTDQILHDPDVVPSRCHSSDKKSTIQVCEQENGQKFSRTFSPTAWCG